MTATQEKVIPYPVTQQLHKPRALSREEVAEALRRGGNQAAQRLLEEFYGFSPLANEVQVLQGKIYISAAGMHRIARESGDLNGIEVELIEVDRDRHFYVAKARVWKKGCERPFEDFADSDGSKMQGGAKLRHAVTRAKARALRSAFAIPFCSLEEMADADIERGRRQQTSRPHPRQQQRPRQAARKAQQEATEADMHPGNLWTAANRYLRGVCGETGVTEDEMLFLLGCDSTKKASAPQMRQLADVLKLPKVRVSAEKETLEARKYLGQTQTMGELRRHWKVEIREVLARGPWHKVLMLRAKEERKAALEAEDTEEQGKLL